MPVSPRVPDRTRPAILEAQSLDLEHSLRDLQTEKTSTKARLWAYEYPLKIPVYYETITSGLGWLNFISKPIAIVPQADQQRDTCSDLQTVCSPQGRNLFEIMGGLALAVDRARLRDVDAEMLRLQHSLSLRRMERRCIQDRIDDYKYPVLTLPNEITSEIFLHYLPVYPDCPPPSGLSSPTFLSHICRKWRQIALATPALWRAISISLDSDLQSGFESKKQILRSWLARSCACPLSIKVNDDLGYQEEDFKYLGEDVLHVIVPHHLRWECLKLRIITDQLHVVAGPVTPLLRELHLKLDVPLATPLTITEAPVLRTVALNDVAATSIILPWAQLTCLTLETVFFSECAPILQQTFNLVHCELRLVTDEEDVQHNLELRCLKSLALVDLDPVAGALATEYLGTFIVPALRKLEVPEVYIGPEPISALTAFMAKSGCMLEEVSITGDRHTPKDLYRKALPFATQLSFDESSSGPDEECG